MRWLSLLALIPLSAIAFQNGRPAPQAGPTFARSVAPFTKKYCLGCHTGASAADGVNLAKIKTLAQAKAEIKMLKKAASEVTAKAMPPKGSVQPPAAERKAFADWVALKKKK